MFKCQQFKDSESDKREQRGSKCQYLNKHDNKNENGLNKDKSKIKNRRYVFFLFISFFLFF